MTPIKICSKTVSLGGLRLIVIAFFQVYFLTAISCGIVSPDKGVESGSDIRRMQQALTEMIRHEKALEKEQALAQNSEPYLLVYRSTHTIELKARGRILRAFSVKDIARWMPENSSESTCTLAEVRPIQRTHRPKIKPGSGEAITAEAAKQMLWGLQRMPRDYDLLCDDGNIFEIRALPPEKSRFSFANAPKTLFRRFVDMCRRWKSPRNNPLQQTIQLWLDENDSRLLFWSLPREIKILVLAELSQFRISSGSLFSMHPPPYPSVCCNTTSRLRSIPFQIGEKFL
jgi:hypothetical protein